MSLKRSSVIHHMYIFKNIMELILLTFFIPVNLYFALEVIYPTQIQTDREITLQFLRPGHLT